MSLSLSLGAVEACALEHNVYIESLPGKVLSLGHSIDSDFLAVYRDRTGSNNGLAVFSKNGLLRRNCVCIFADFAAVAALSCIIFEKMSKHSGACKVVDGNNFITLCTEHLSESETTDSAETVNSNFN